MQAVILAAGLGTRLRPLTHALPKAMVPICGKPILLHHIERFKRHGVDEFFINLHYLPEEITDYFGDGRKFGVRITYSFEPELLGTAGAMKKMEEKLGEHFFLMYGDMYSLLDYGKFLQFHKNQPTDSLGAMVVGDTDYPDDSDLVELDSAGRFLRISPKPHAILPERCLAMKAAYIFSKEILRSIPGNTYYEIDHQLLPDIIIRNLPFYGYVSQEYLRDIGTKERYESVEKFIASQNFS